MADKIYNVLFLCTGNSARSVLAEAILTEKGKGRFRAFSAGSMPTGQVNPFTIQLLNNLGYDTSEYRSKSWNEFEGDGVPVMDFVITVCDSAAGEVCPIWPGHPMTAHWGFPDPAAHEGSDTEKAAVFGSVYGQIERRIDIFLNLPFESLDLMVLKEKIKKIGETDVTEEA